MADPKWLEEDKELPEVAEWVTAKLPPMERQSATVEQLVGALKRAHAWNAELRRVLEESRPWHVYCDDPWYSCPKAEDGCANPSDGDNCNCRADEKNAAIDAVLLRDEPPEVNDG